MGFVKRDDHYFRYPLTLFLCEEVITYDASCAAVQTLLNRVWITHVVLSVCTHFLANRKRFLNCYVYAHRENIQTLPCPKPLTKLLLLLFWRVFVVVVVGKNASEINQSISQSINEWMNDGMEWDGLMHTNDGPNWKFDRKRALTFPRHIHAYSLERRLLDPSDDVSEQNTQKSFFRPSKSTTPPHRCRDYHLLCLPNSTLQSHVQPTLLK